jgi:hypothetical protein
MKINKNACFKALLNKKLNSRRRILFEKVIKNVFKKSEHYQTIIMATAKINPQIVV